MREWPENPEGLFQYLSLFLVQDVTLQAGFNSIQSSSPPIAHSPNSLGSLLHATVHLSFLLFLFFFSRHNNSPLLFCCANMSKKWRHVSVRVAFWPAWLQGAFVKERLIFRLGWQVSHGLSSRWQEWGHDVVMGGGTAGLCVCVCVLKPLNNCCEGGETHQRPSLSVFPLNSRCRFTPSWPSAVDSSKWRQRIDLPMHERDGLLQRAPGDKRGRGPQHTPGRENHLCFV